MRVGPGQRALINGVFAFENGTAHALEVEYENGGMRVRPAPELPAMRVISENDVQRERARMLDGITRRYLEPEPFIVHPNMLDELCRVLGDTLNGAGAGPAEHFDAAAIDRARALLRRNLTTQQRKSFDRYGSFVVIGNQSHAHYTIKDTGRVIRQTDQHEFCLQVVGEPVPVEDAMLARKCLIESNEELFLSTANDLSEQSVGLRRAEMEAREIARREMLRQCRLAERAAFHTRAMTMQQIEAEFPNPTLTDRLRALVARTRG